MLSLDLTIRTYGWQLHQITDDNPWSYTIGLLESYDHPELMVTGLELELTSILDFDITFIWDRIQNPRPNAAGIVPEQDDFRLTFFLGLDF